MTELRNCSFHTYLQFRFQNSLKGEGIFHSPDPVHYLGHKTQFADALHFYRDRKA